VDGATNVFHSAAAPKEGMVTVPQGTAVTFLLSLRGDDASAEPPIALTDGDAYTLHVRAQHPGEEVITSSLDFVADSVAPTGFSIDPTPLEIDDVRPEFTGILSIGARDWDIVNGEIVDPTTGEFVAYYPLTTTAATNWHLAGLLEFDTPGDVPARLVRGRTYTFYAYHCDIVFNCTTASRTFRVAGSEDPGPSPDQQSPPSGGPSDVPPTDGATQQGPTQPASQGTGAAVAGPAPASSSPGKSTVVPQRPVAPRLVARELLDAVIPMLREAPLRRLLTKGIDLTVDAHAAGEVVVQIYRARAHKAVPAGPAAPIASGRRKLHIAGPATVRLKPARAARRLTRERRLPVVVRTVFVPISGRAVTSDRRLVLER
jgi:hypothetical protein